jgi:AraC family transcriptional regulator of adaptative response/methylated-DNA-[protein]-cysteine methyltransferase
MQLQQSGVPDDHINNRAPHDEVAQAARRLAASVAGRLPPHRVALLIPCHRVVGADGRLAGYRWGVQRKAELLRREKG